MGSKNVGFRISYERNGKVHTAWRTTYEHALRYGDVLKLKGAHDVKVDEFPTTIVRTQGNGQ